MNKDKIAEWHTLSKYQLTDETLTKRYDSIEKIAQRNDLPFWLDIVRLYLGVKDNGENITFFAKTFQDGDTNFPVLKIEKLLKVLAGIAIICKLELATEGTQEEDEEEEAAVEGEETATEEEEEIDHSEVAFVISNALTNAIFFNQYKLDSKIPVLQTAKEYLVNFSNEQRENDLSEHETSIKEIEDRLSEEEEGLDAEEELSIVNAAQALLKANKIQAEEINILWWIFGAYSEMAEKYFGAIDVSAMTIIGAKELNDLSEFSGELPSAPHILRKVLGLCGGGNAELKNYSVKECVDSLSESLKNKILNGKETLIDELTPCMFALKKSTTTGWHKSVGYNVEDKLNPSIITLQYYKEILFLNSIA